MVKAASNAVNVGKNVGVTVEGSILTIRIDLSKSQGPSKSGKSTVIATTEGNMVVPGGNGAVMGINVYRKA